MNTKCRVGMTTNPEGRKAYWEREISNITDWKWYGPYDSKEEAQAFETHLASIHGCESHPGGRDPEGNKKWWVYKFTYLENCAEPTNPFSGAMGQHANNFSWGDAEPIPAVSILTKAGFPEPIPTVSILAKAGFPEPIPAVSILAKACGPQK